MSALDKPLHEYIQSGEYYADARSWYKDKYINPLFHRSVILLITAIIIILFAGILFNINKLFPLVVQVKYSIESDSLSNKNAQIERANQIENDPLLSIADIMIKNYVIRRESYNYNNLKKQFVFVKNNSTRIVFRKFYNFMNIDNPDSPVLLYQKSRNKNPSIISLKHLEDGSAVVKFNSEAHSNRGENVEKAVWQATIKYEIDKINPNLASGSRFNFTVTDYQLELLNKLEDSKK